MHDPHANNATSSRFFFRVFTDGVERHRSEGLLFTDKHEVWQEASTSTGEILREIDGKMQPGLDWRMDVTDEAGQLIYRFSFKAEDFSALSSEASANGRLASRQP
jgi:hypothetical protein